MTQVRVGNNFDISAIMAMLAGVSGDVNSPGNALTSNGNAEAEPGGRWMTNAEALQLLKDMQSRSGQFADQAVAQGLIAPDQRAEFQNLISARIQVMEQQRNGIDVNPTTNADARIINQSSPDLSNALNQILIGQYDQKFSQNVDRPSNNNQSFVDPVAEAFATDVDDMVDELRFNPSSNLAEEAAQILNSPLVAKLGAGVLADLRAAVQLQGEKAANGSDAFMRGDRVWDEREKREEKERKDQAKIADMADDLNNSQQRLTEQQWDEGTYDFAGEPMTGAQIDGLMAFMRNPANRQRLIEQRAKAKGISTEQAARDVDLGLRYAELFRKNEMGTATAEEQAELARLRNNPTVTEVISEARKLEREAGPTAPMPEIRQSQNENQTISVAARIDRLDNPNASQAPPLRDHHRAALAATVPLDVPAEPVRIAAIAPAPEQVAATGMNF